VIAIHQRHSRQTNRRSDGRPDSLMAF